MQFTHVMSGLLVILLAAQSAVALPQPLWSISSPASVSASLAKRGVHPDAPVASFTNGSSTSMTTVSWTTQVQDSNGWLLRAYSRPAVTASMAGPSLVPLVSSPAVEHRNTSSTSASARASRVAILAATPAVTHGSSSSHVHTLIPSLTQGPSRSALGAVVNGHPTSSSSSTLLVPSSTFKTVTGTKSTSVAIPAAAPTSSATIDRPVTEKDHKLVAAILPGISVPAAVTAAGVRPLCRWVLAVSDKARAVFKAAHKGVDFLGEKSPAYADYFEKVARSATRAAANAAEGAGDVASGTVEGVPVHGSVGVIEDAPAHGAVDAVEGTSSAAEDAVDVAGGTVGRVDTDVEGAAGLSGSTAEGAAAAAEEAGSTALLSEGTAELAVTEASAIDAGFAADVAPSVVSAFEAGAAEIAASPEEIGTLLETSWAQDVRLESWLESIAPHRGTWELEKPAQEAMPETSPKEEARPAEESDPESPKSVSSGPDTPQPESPEPATPRPATPEPVTSEPEMVEPESPRLDSPQTGTPQPETPPPGSPQQKPSVSSSPAPESPLPEAEMSLPESPSLESQHSESPSLKSPGSSRPGSLPEEPLPEAAIPLPESPRPESPESARPASPQPGMPHAVPETPPPASPEPGSPETESPLPESGIPLPESPPPELPQPDARRPETPRPDAPKADTPEPERQGTKRPIKFLEPEMSEQEKVRLRHIETEARRLYKLERAPDGATLKEKIKWFNDRNKMSIPQTDGSGNVEQYTDAEIGQVLEKLEHELGHDSVPQTTTTEAKGNGAIDKINPVEKSKPPTPEMTHHLELVHEAEEYSHSQSTKGSWHSKHATRKYQKHDRQYWDAHPEEEAKLLLEMQKPPMARVERLINNFSKPDVSQVDGPGERHYTEAQLRDALQEIEHERAQEEARVKQERKAMKEHKKAEKYAKKCAHWQAKDPKRNKGYVAASIVTFGGSDLLRKVAVKHYCKPSAALDNGAVNVGTPAPPRHQGQWDQENRNGVTFSGGRRVVKREV